jgi:hypothetical protein
MVKLCHRHDWEAGSITAKAELLTQYVLNGPAVSPQPSQGEQVSEDKPQGPTRRKGRQQQA